METSLDVASYLHRNPDHMFFVVQLCLITTSGLRTSSFILTRDLETEDIFTICATSEARDLRRELNELGLNTEAKLKSNISFKLVTLVYFSVFSPWFWMVLDLAVLQKSKAFANINYFRLFSTCLLRQGRVDRESLMELLEGQAWQSSHSEKQKLEKHLEETMKGTGK